MSKLHDLLPLKNHTTLTSTPDGAEGIILSYLLTHHTDNILHIARDDSRMMHLVDYIRFFTPNTEILTLPAWDCLPYDRVSPNPRVSSERINTLSKIALEPEAKKPRIVITTVNALLQRVPPKDFIQSASFKASVGDRLDRNDFIHYLAEHGYNRTENVTDAGEFAVRGSIVDLFTGGEEHGLRLDFFGDTLESIRTFDPLTQISGGTQQQLMLTPASEILLDEDAIQLFRNSYRKLFGAVTSDDPLYLAVTEGRKYAGMEHWLPLFYDRLDTIFDYLPKATISFDHLAIEARNERLEIIQDYYKARTEQMISGDSYHALPPADLYLDQLEWNARTSEHITLSATPFAADAFQSETTTSRNLGFTGIPDFSAEAKKTNKTPLTLAKDFLAERTTANARHQKRKRIIIACFSTGSRERLGRMLTEQDIQSLQLNCWSELKNLSPKTIGLALLALEHGFEHDDIIIISEQDLLGDRIIRSPARKRKAENFLSEAASLTAGEIVAHKEHGIAQFEGLETIEVGGESRDFLRLLYAGGDKLYVPVENIELISRYGAEEGVRLDRLGHTSWQARKAKLKKRIQIAAEELLRIAAERELRTAPELVPMKGMYEEFCARFPYAETDDQLRAIEDIEEDLASGKPMDRLICGDVGFGKTEVALRTAFMAAANDSEGKVQIAVVSPTTLLCRQHYKTFTERFAGFPIRIRQLSRLVPAKDAKLVREEIKNGQVDIVVGTHALLAKNISFKNLGLLIVDEEQHFGVAQKERLKQLREDVHILTLSATPIPRTLQMSLSGIKTLSLIATPPVDRLAIRTYVMPYDSVVIREAIMREHYRGGRIFYVCPRVSDLHEVEEKLKKLVPEIKIVKAHGQMPPSDLDDIMNAFYDGKFDLLLSTTIVESGLDVPSANTMIIHRADMFGLSQLYQLRGRVGRGKIRAYAYLTLPPKRTPTKDALKRLEVMQSLDTLGAGFTIASHDMDIRGFGNLVGEEQSGHIREVGIELYQEMLREAIEGIKQRKSAEALGKKVAEEVDEYWSPTINLGISVLIPEKYVSDLQLRLGLYRRIATLETEKDVEGFAAELIDRFGPLPSEVEHLMDVVKMKQLCRQAGIEKIDTGPKGVIFSFRNNSFAAPEKLIEFIAKNTQTVKLRSDHKLFFSQEWESQDNKVTSIRKSLNQIADLAA